MMESNIKLGLVRGIPIGLHRSWFLIFILVTWSLASAYFPAEYPNLSTPVYWGLGLITSVLFFGSVLLHELGHAFIAQRNRVPVRRITLFIFGGVAQMGRDPATPGTEFRIAIAGPVVSLALAAVFAGFWYLDRAIPYLAAPSLWLARINLLLGLFNLVPGFPLDGGRVLRSAIWKITGNFQRATHIAATFGQVVAFGFIVWGLYTVLRGQFFTGFWLVLIGWFLQNAAAATYRQMTLRESLGGITVRQMMVSPCQEVSGSVSLMELVNQRVFKEGAQCFYIANTGQLDGLLTLKDITSIPRERWERVTAEQAMVPQEQLVTATPDMDLVQALSLMDDTPYAQLPVMEGDRFVGMLSRDQIIHFIRLRTELNV